MADYASWDGAQVASWLESISPVFKKYSDQWREEVTGDMLPDLDDEALVELGVKSGLHRKRILRAASELTASSSSSPAVDEEKECRRPAKKAKKTDADREKKSGTKKGRADDGEKEEAEAKEEGEPNDREVKDDAGGDVDATRPTPDVSEGVEVCISFDTTGSMYPCLSQVRRNVQSTVRRLLKDIPHIRIALVAHGDYGDEGSTYVIKTLNFTSDEQTLVDWVQDVEQTCGYDGDECYELVLRDIQKLAWSPLCRNRSLVLIGDSNPHPIGSNNPYNIDWREQARKLREKNIRVYAVHALGYRHSEDFYRSVARETEGTYLKLSQFNSVVDFVCGICYRQADVSQLEAYEREVRARGGMDRAVRALFDALLGRETAREARRADGLVPVRAGRFQVLEVDKDRIAIKVFAQEQGLVFKTGRGFYQFTKPEHVSMKKEIVLMHKETGDMFTGEAARTLLGITDSTSQNKVKIKPSDFGEFDVFVQSTSYNRCLVKGTKFLYEVDEER